MAHNPDDMDISHRTMLELMELKAKLKSMPTKMDLLIYLAIFFGLNALMHFVK